MNELLGCPFYECPFCHKDCDVGLDCECGAHAVNSVFWPKQSEPVMPKGLEVLPMKKTKNPKGED
jgi:hypothetical protein